MNNNSVAELIIDQEKFSKVYFAMKDDEQSKALLLKIAIEFTNLFSLTDNQWYALNRLRNLIQSENRDPLGDRNQIFKIANELGLKLPSHIF